MIAARITLLSGVLSTGKISHRQPVQEQIAVHSDWENTVLRVNSLFFFHILQVFTLHDTGRCCAVWRKQIEGIALRATVIPRIHERSGSIRYLSIWLAMKL